MQFNRLLTSLSGVVHNSLRSYSNNPGPSTRHFKLFCYATGVSTVGVASYNILKKHKIETIPVKPVPIRFDMKKVDNLSELNLRSRFNFINKVVERCAPAVVYVEIKDPRKLERGTDSALIVSNGSGFVINEDGWILTNAHVVISKPNAVVEVKMYDGKTYKATVEDADMNIDLALIKIDAGRKLQALNLAKSGDVSIGEWVVALGSPLSLSHSATAGVVSSVNRPAGELGLRNYQMRYIQTDAPITFGNSGGPLVNLDGDVIGINNLRITAGISFAIPIDYVSKFLDKITYARNSTEKREISNNIGVTAITMTPEIFKSRFSFNPTGDELDKGVLIWKVINGSIGDKGGLKLGDIVTRVDGVEIAKSNELYARISAPNRAHDLEIVRMGQKMKLVINSN